VLSQRSAGASPADLPAFAGWHEPEDVLVATGGAELLPMTVHTGQPVMRIRRLAGRALRRIAGPRALLPPGNAVDRCFDRRRSRPVDHVVFIGHSPFDLTLLERLRVVRRRTGVLSVWLPEAWPSSFADGKLWREPFSLVDHLFVGHPAVADSFARLAPRAAVHVLPLAVDVVRFGPADPRARRPIDVLGIGRRDPVQHARLLDWAARNDRFYLYDTLVPRVRSWSEHRMAVADWYRRSSVTLCNYAKHDLPAVIGDVRTVPGRLFEGLAAGAILIGNPPDDLDQKELVGQTVVEPFEGPEGGLNPLVDAAPDDPAVVAHRCRNMALACRQHDWGHRWQAMLQTFGLPVPAELEARLRHLAQRADELDALAASVVGSAWR
jgi:hypothetical protein